MPGQRVFDLLEVQLDAFPKPFPILSSFIFTEKRGTDGFSEWPDRAIAFLLFKVRTYQGLRLPERFGVGHFVKQTPLPGWQDSSRFDADTVLDLFPDQVSTLF